MAKILVVDDEVQVRELIARVLGTKGFQVTTAPRADQAFAAMEKEVFDLVLTDVNMPGETGLSLVKSMRQAHSKTPIVVYSGVLTVEMERELREAGANEVLRKDVGVRTLAEQIGKVVNAKERLFKTPLARSEKLVLIADDEEAVRRLLSDFFMKKGYGIRKAESGEAAVEAAKRERPSVVLLDVHMPGIGGLAALKKLLEIHPGLGILMMSGAHHDEDTVQEALAMGAYGFILKPFDFLYLELVVTSKLLIAESD